MKKIDDFIAGKKLALIGNAKSVFNQERIVDNEFDIICRINAGLPYDKEKYLGKRTDILFLSTGLTENAIKRFGAKYIIWCTPKVEYMTEWIGKNSLRYPIKNWNRLYYLLKHRPSTGIMAFNCLECFDFESLTLIGFDFWKSPTWYTNTIRPSHHSPKDEERYIRDKIKEYKGKIRLI